MHSFTIPLAEFLTTSIFLNSDVLEKESRNKEDFFHFRLAFCLFCPTVNSFFILLLSEYLMFNSDINSLQ